MKSWDERLSLIPFYSGLMKVDEQMVEFYVRDLCDWEAALKRLGFKPHRKIEGMWYWTVELARGLTVEGRARKLSHMVFILQADSPESNTLNIEFGYPQTNPDPKSMKFGFVEMLGCNWTFKYHNVDDTGLRRFERDLRNLAQVFSTRPFEDVRMLQDYCGTIFGSQMHHAPWTRKRNRGEGGFYLADLLKDYICLKNTMLELNKFAAVRARQVSQNKVEHRRIVLHRNMRPRGGRR